MEWDTNFLLQAASQFAFAVAFLYITYNIPAMWAKWVENRKEERVFEAREKELDRADRELDRKYREAADEADRVSRHKTASDFTTMLLQQSNENRKSVDQVVSSHQLTLDKVLSSQEKRENMLRRELAEMVSRMCRYPGGNTRPLRALEEQT